MATSVPGLVIYIYTLSDPRTGAVRYVGQTPDPVRRLWDHLKPANLRAETHRNHWLRSLLADGVKPIMTVIEFCDEGTWAAAERRQIAAHRAMGWPLTNGTPGGEGGYGNTVWLGRQHTEATRLKMSESAKEVWRRRRAGLPAILEYKPAERQRSEPKRHGRGGRPLSAEHRAKLSAALTGRRLSPEHSAKTAAAQRGKPRPAGRGEGNGNARLTLVQVEEIRRRYAAGGLTFTALAKEYGVHRASIANVVRGRCWQHDRKDALLASA